MNEPQNSYHDPLPDHGRGDPRVRNDSGGHQVRRPASEETCLAEVRYRAPLPFALKAGNRVPLAASTVFVNLPFHTGYHAALIEIVVGCVAHGLVPEIVTIQTGALRLPRLIQLIQTCVLSIHDLSYLKHDHPRGLKPVPRFNMPFELGLVLGDSLDHEVLVLERHRYITQRSLSDVNGLDCRAYQLRGDIIQAIGDKVYLAAAPSPRLIQRLHQEITGVSRQILRDHHRDLFGARAFHRLVLATQVKLSTLQQTQGA